MDNKHSLSAGKIKDCSLSERIKEAEAEQQEGIKDFNEIERIVNNMLDERIGHLLTSKELHWVIENSDDNGTSHIVHCSEESELSMEEFIWRMEKVREKRDRHSNPDSVEYYLESADIPLNTLLLWQRFLYRFTFDRRPGEYWTNRFFEINFEAFVRYMAVTYDYRGFLSLQNSDGENFSEFLEDDVKLSEILDFAQCRTARLYNPTGESIGEYIIECIIKGNMFLSYAFYRPLRFLAYKLKGTGYSSPAYCLYDDRRWFDCTAFKKVANKPSSIFLVQNKQE